MNSLNGNEDSMLTKAFRLLMKVTKLKFILVDQFGDDSSVPIIAALEEFIRYVEENSQNWESLDIPGQMKNVQDDSDERYENITSMFISLADDVDKCKQIIH